MKRFFKILSIAFLLSFASCAEKPKETIPSQKEEFYVTNVGKMKVYKYDYEGHSYQMHYRSNGNATVAGVVHDPDCKCFEKIND